MMRTLSRWAMKMSITTALCAAGTLSASADEGMWLFNNPPRELLKQKYDFDATDPWLNHLMHSAVRFNSGGSGSFVSPDGLVMTNHHVAADSLQKLSTPDRDLMTIGFHAKTREEEMKCVDLELNVLMSIEDVTDRVKAAVKPDISMAEAQAARRSVMAEIEKESLEKTGLRSDVVTLYQGGRYHLYRYKKYTDVRLVFAPERDIAFFGGDPDNFEYPRYDLDVSFFRVYENDQPVKPEHWLKWNPSAPTEGELVFVAGHPGRTDRLNTVDHLKFLRDRFYPLSLDRIRRGEVLLSTYSDRGIENKRQAQDQLFGLQNSRKARLGGLAGLQDPAIVAAKTKAEESLRASAGDEEPWKAVREAIAAYEPIMSDFGLLEGGSAFGSEAYQIARILLRLSEESTKPNGERLREYRDSNLESLKQDLFSEAPIYPELEQVRLADSLSLLLERKGADDPLVVQIMNGKSPSARAAELLAGTKLADVAERKRLAEGGKAAIDASDDTMIQLAKLVDPPARKLRAQYEQQYDEPMKQAYAKLADLRFKALGTNTYPDATFTLRLAFGTIKGVEQPGGETIPPWTTIGGAYEHAKAHGEMPPFQLPKNWIEKKDQLDLNTPFNFISTADIIGGNSGSPVVNRAGELVGIIFDGNIESLVLDFAYTDARARAVSVHAAGIVEALKKVYDAQELVGELLQTSAAK